MRKHEQGKLKDLEQKLENELGRKNYHAGELTATFDSCRHPAFLDDSNRRAYERRIGQENYKKMLEMYIEELDADGLVIHQGFSCEW